MKTIAEFLVLNANRYAEKTAIVYKDAEGFYYLWTEKKI